MTCNHLKQREDQLSGWRTIAFLIILIGLASSHHDALGTLLSEDPNPSIVLRMPSVLFTTSNSLERKQQQTTKGYFSGSWNGALHGRLNHKKPVFRMVKKRRRCWLKASQAVSAYIRVFHSMSSCFNRFLSHMTNRGIPERAVWPKYGAGFGKR